MYIGGAYLFCESMLYVTDFNNGNRFLTSELLKQGFCYHKLNVKHFLISISDSQSLIVKYNVCLKTLLQQFISEPGFYGY